MKTYLKRLPILIYAGIALVVCLKTEAFKKDEFMDVKKARTLWGDLQFNANSFKAGDSKVRASMAASLVEGKTFIGKPTKDVREKLGTPTGYYFSDLIPAYAIGDLSPDRKETWQIIFLPTNDGNSIAEVKIQKKCCYK